MASNSVLGKRVLKLDARVVALERTVAVLEKIAAEVTPPSPEKPSKPVKKRATIKKVTGVK